MLDDHSVMFAQEPTCSSTSPCRNSLSYCNLDAQVCLGAPSTSTINVSLHELPAAWRRGSNHGGRACVDAASRLRDLSTASQQWHRLRSRKFDRPAAREDLLDGRRRRAAAAGDRSCWGCWVPKYEAFAPGIPRARPHAQQPCCSGRGDCVLGLCVCHSGAYGIDCAHGHAHGHTQPPPPARRGLAIYVYDLPAEIGSVSLKVPRYGHQGSLYWAEKVFVDALLRDTAVRTLDPNLADLFYIPLWSVELGSNTGCARGHVDIVSRYVAQTYPFWNRTAGADHVLFLPGDKGACGVGPTNLIIISHWGLLGPWSTMEAAASKRYWSSVGQDAHALSKRLRSGQVCHAPHKDIVVPPFHMLNGALRTPPPNPNRRVSYTLAHAGGVWSWKNVGTRQPGYSQGVRQALWAQFNGSAHQELGLPMLLTTARIDESDWLNSALCLAPSGEGFGQRVSKFALLGCVPLIAQVLPLLASRSPDCTSLLPLAYLIAPPSLPLRPVLYPSPIVSNRLPPSPTVSHRLPPSPTFSHLLPPSPTFSHLLPPSPTFL